MCKIKKARPFTSTTSPFSNEPDVQRVQRERTEGQKPTHACRKLVCRGALELYYFTTRSVLALRSRIRILFL